MANVFLLTCIFEEIFTPIFARFHPNKNHLTLDPTLSSTVSQNIKFLCVVHWLRNFSFLLRIFVHLSVHESRSFDCGFVNTVRNCNFIDLQRCGNKNLTHNLVNLVDFGYGSCKFIKSVSIIINLQNNLKSKINILQKV